MLNVQFIIIIRAALVPLQGGAKVRFIVVTDKKEVGRKLSVSQKRDSVTTEYSPIPMVYWFVGVVLPMMELDLRLAIC